MAQNQKLKACDYPRAVAVLCGIVAQQNERSDHQGESTDGALVRHTGRECGRYLRVRAAGHRRNAAVLFEAVRSAHRGHHWQHE